MRKPGSGEYQSARQEIGPILEGFVYFRYVRRTLHIVTSKLLHKTGFRRLPAAACLAMCMGFFPVGVDGKPASTSSLPSIAILDLVDMVDNQRRGMVTDMIRKLVVESGRWDLFPADSAARKLREFNFNPALACNAPQCSFDAGNILQVQYVLFGTVAALDKYNSFTLKLLHVPSAQVVWTDVGESKTDILMERSPLLAQAFQASIKKLSPQVSERSDGTAKTTLAVLDLSQPSIQSRVLHERVSTYIYRNQHYQVMDQGEQAELLKALEINKYSVVPSNDNMINLGEKLGVGQLLYFRLYKQESEFIYLLSHYDVERKEQILQMPAQPSVEVSSLFTYERDFFDALNAKTGKKGAVAGSKKAQSLGKANSALWVSLAVLGLGGGVAAYWSLNGEEEKPGWDPGAPPLPPPDIAK